ncbi:Hypothetical protein CINCED_3A009471 [Cinara cedri]|uniref:Uncharacterized protein n=1 Tax=Cinara cedri TaxID=506608 RepID=A0A5E4M4Q9_9HEMI|nr:Hypothetical protein CINCED_3A009471 [Cinara cedri]
MYRIPTGKPFDSPAHSCASSSSYNFQYYDQHDVHRGFANRGHAFHGDLDATATVLAKRSKYEHCRPSVERNRSNKVRRVYPKNRFMLFFVRSKMSNRCLTSGESMPMDAPRHRYSSANKADDRGTPLPSLAGKGVFL